MEIKIKSNQENNGNKTKNKPRDSQEYLYIM